MSKITTIWTYQLNNVQTEFAVNFDYLSRKFVQVTLIGKDRKVLRMNVDYRFIGPKMIKTNKPWGSNDGYQYLEIRRVTSATDSIVDFSDGSILRAGDLTIANLQSMHIAEEARNLAGDALGVNDEGNLDARARRIVNVANPVGRLDAVNKAYVDDAKDGAVQARDKALQYRNEAEAFKNQANTFRGQAESAKDRAVTAESNARNSASSAQSFKDQAITQASKATQMASQAQTSASEAKKSQTASKTSETNAARDAKRAEDAAATAIGGGLPITGGTMTGDLILKSAFRIIGTDASIYIDRPDAGGVSWRITPLSVNGDLGFWSNTGGWVYLPKESNGTLALTKNYVPRTGGTFAGKLSIENAVAQFDLKTPKTHFSFNLVDTVGDKAYVAYRKADGNTLYKIDFPRKQGTFAIADDYVPKTGGTFTGDITLNNQITMVGNNTNIYINSTQSKGVRWRIAPLSTNGNLGFWSSTRGWVEMPQGTGTLALRGQYKLDDHYKRTRSSIAKSKVSERELRKEIEDLKIQIAELKELLNAKH